MINNRTSSFIKYLNPVINHAYNLMVGQTHFKVKFEDISLERMGFRIMAKFHAFVIGKACNICNRGSTLKSKYGGIGRAY